MLNYRTAPLSRNTLRGIVGRIKSGKTPVDRFSASKDNMVRLIIFLIEMVDGMVEEKGQSSPLARKLDTLKLGISRVERFSLTFEALEAADPDAFVSLFS